MNRAQYAAMFNLLQRTRTKYAECIKVTRADGLTHRFTAHDRPLTLLEDGGTIGTYLRANSFSLTSLETTAGLVVSNMDIEGAIDDDAISENDLRDGLYDNAKVELFIAYWSKDKVSVLPLRVSWIGEIQMDGPKFKVDLRGIAQRLAQTFVKATSLECRYNFCDADCQLIAENYTEEVTVTEVISRDTFKFSVQNAVTSNFFQWGLAKWTSGDNAGVKMEILRHYEDQVQLFLPLNKPIEVGDIIDMTGGCSKSWDRCGSFGNRVNFGGEPFLAGNDMLSRYPSDTPDESEKPGGLFGLIATLATEVNNR